MKANRVISLLLMFTMILPLTTVTGNTNVNIVTDVNREMDLLDILLVSHRYMSRTEDNAEM